MYIFKIFCCLVCKQHLYEIHTYFSKSFYSRLFSSMSFCLFVKPYVVLMVEFGIPLVAAVVLLIVIHLVSGKPLTRDFEIVNSFCSTSDNRRVTIVTNQVISHE